MQKVLKNNVLLTYSIKGSKFIAIGFNVKSDSEIKTIASELKKLHKKAAHVCYGALFCENNQIIKRFDDDNEPYNTAGKKILSALEENDFINSLIVVVRYKNRSLLGVGLLAKSYYNASFSLANDKHNYELFEPTIVAKIKIDSYAKQSELLE